MLGRRSLPPVILQETVYCVYTTLSVLCRCMNHGLLTIGTLAVVIAKGAMALEDKEFEAMYIPNRELAYTGIQQGIHGESYLMAGYPFTKGEERVHRRKSGKRV